MSVNTNPNVGGPLPVQPQRAQPVQTQQPLPPTTRGTVAYHLLTGTVIPATTFGFRVMLAEGGKNLVMQMTGIPVDTVGGAFLEAGAASVAYAGAGKLTGGHEHGVLSVASIGLARGINTAGKKCCMNRDLIGVVAWSGKDRKFQDNMITFAFPGGGMLRTIICENKAPTGSFQDPSSPVWVGAMSGFTAVTVPLLAHDGKIPVAPLPGADKLLGMYLGRVRAGVRMEHDNLLPVLNFLGHMALRLSIGGPMDSPRNALVYGVFNNVMHYIRVNGWTMARQVAEVPDGKLYQGKGSIEALLQKMDVGHASQSEQHHKVQTEGVVNTTSEGVLHHAEKLFSDTGVVLCGVALASADLGGDTAKIGGMSSSTAITLTGAVGCFGASLVLTGLRECARATFTQPLLEASDTARLFVSTTLATAFGGPVAGLVVGGWGLLLNAIPKSKESPEQDHALEHDDGSYHNPGVEMVISSGVPVPVWEDVAGGGDVKGVPVVEGNGGPHNIVEVQDDGAGLGPDGGGTPDTTEPLTARDFEPQRR